MTGVNALGSAPAMAKSYQNAIERVKAYVNKCRRSVDENLERAPEDVVYMALEHRLMHLLSPPLAVREVDNSTRLTYCVFSQASFGLPPGGQAPVTADVRGVSPGQACPL